MIRQDVADKLEAFCREEGLGYGLVVFMDEDGRPVWSMWAEGIEVNMVQDSLMQALHISETYRGDGDEVD